jgi:glycosyltransferase involved in cell wall biosynthesis
LVEPRDPVELASAVAGLLDDPARAAAMGRAGRARRRAEFDISVTVREVERIYTALAAGIPAAELTGERR